MQIKYPSQAPAAICCILRDPKHGSGDMASTFWNKQQQQSPYACTTNDAERGLCNFLRNMNGASVYTSYCVNLCSHYAIDVLKCICFRCLSQFTEFTGEGCRWIGCKVREKRERLKNGTRIVRDRKRDHHHRKTKKKSTQTSFRDTNIISGTQCLGSSGSSADDHILVDDVEPEEPPVYIEEEEGLKSEATTETTFQNQSTCEPECSKGVTVNSVGTSMAASVVSDDCNTTSSPWVGGTASSVKDKNYFRPPMVRFVADVTAPDLTSFSPGKLSVTCISTTTSLPSLLFFCESC